MIEAAEDLRFLGEATEQLVRPEPGPQHLHRHLPRAVDGVPLVDAPHSPFAEHPRQAHAVKLHAEEWIVAGLPRRRRAQLPQGLEIEAVDVGRVTLDGLTVGAWLAGALLVGVLLDGHWSAPRCYGRSPRKRVWKYSRADSQRRRTVRSEHPRTSAIPAWVAPRYHTMSNTARSSSGSSAATL